MTSERKKSLRSYDPEATPREAPEPSNSSRKRRKKAAESPATPSSKARQKRRAEDLPDTTNRNSVIMSFVRANLDLTAAAKEFGLEESVLEQTLARHANSAAVREATHFS